MCPPFALDLLDVSEERVTTGKEVHRRVVLESFTSSSPRRSSPSGCSGTGKGLALLLYSLVVYLFFITAVNVYLISEFAFTAVMTRPTRFCLALLPQARFSAPNACRLHSISNINDINTVFYPHTKRLRRHPRGTTQQQK